ncbi:MAG: response regulator [Rubrivivax sp.]|nr:MAG: response regulator [Rubrivivax sp.]
MSLPSLQVRLNRAVFATTLCALLLSAASLLAFEGLTVRNTLVRDLSTQADLVARSVVAALAFDDPHTAQESVELLRQRPRVLAAEVLRADGGRFASFGPPPDAHGLLTEEPSHRFAGSHLVAVYPVVQGEERLGWVVVEAEHDLWERLFHYALIEAVVTLVALSVAFVVFRGLQRSITRPLLHIGDIATQATSRRDWSVRAVETADNADVAALLAAFNRMLSEVQGSTLELEREMEERGRAEAALRQADRTKDEFLATLGHELRNPLAPMVNSVALLRRRGADPALAQKAIEILDRQLRHISKLIDDLLDVSRIKTGKLRLSLERLDLAPLARAVAESVAPQAAERGLRFSAELPERACLVSGDAVRLAQVLNNLLNNAMRYTPSGGEVELRLACDQDRVRLEVRDSGIGVPEALQEEIFDLFAQGDKRLERGNTGLGIGLTLARQLVRLHGGDISLHSEGANLGACFVVDLPAIAEAPPPEQPASPAQATAAGLPRGRVLIADDNVDFASTLAALLEDHGCATEVVHNGMDALASLQARPAAMAVLDIGMPGLNGYELARRLKQDPRTRAIPLVAVTGWGQASDRQAAAQAGFDHHLMKPVSSDAILALLGALASTQPS